MFGLQHGVRHNNKGRLKHNLRQQCQHIDNMWSKRKRRKCAEFRWHKQNPEREREQGIVLRSTTRRETHPPTHTHTHIYIQGVRSEESVCVCMCYVFPPFLNKHKHKGKTKAERRPFHKRASERASGPYHTLTKQTARRHTETDMGRSRTHIFRLA